MSPVEVTTKHATTVDDLPAAWAFVMARIDRVGPDPRITISPIWTYGDGEDGNTRRFEVSVSGMTTEQTADHDQQGEP